jgi:NAD(P)-dependent dehydrogenase (short-subunit alcohol dehydrogenase family)
MDATDAGSAPRASAPDSASDPAGAGGLVDRRPVALVTGASRGLGFLIARELGRRGHDLAICARSGDGLRAAAEDLRGLGTEVEAIEADAGSAEQAGKLVERVQRRFGRLDVLCLGHRRGAGADAYRIDPQCPVHRGP